MGFGVLFIGYFIATIAGMAFPEIAGFTGFALICIALMSLAEYDKRFGYTLIAAVPATLICLVLTAGVLLGYFGISIPSPIAFVMTYSDRAMGLVKFFFHVMLCYAVRGIAQDTGADKLCFPALRNMYIYAACYAVDVLSIVLSDGAKYLVPIATLVYLVTIILFHVMIFSAYMYICDEKDADMEIKKTNIKWYDSLVEKTAEREQKAADDTKDYFKAKYDRKLREKNERAEKNAQKHNHKKKK